MYSQLHGRAQVHSPVAPCRFSHDLVALLSLGLPVAAQAQLLFSEACGTLCYCSPSSLARNLTALVLPGGQTRRESSPASHCSPSVTTITAGHAPPTSVQQLRWERRQTSLLYGGAGAGQERNTRLMLPPVTLDQHTQLFLRAPSARLSPARLITSPPPARRAQEPFQKPDPRTRPGRELSSPESCQSPSLHHVWGPSLP